MKFLHLFIFIITMSILTSGSCDSKSPNDNECDRYFVEANKLFDQFNEYGDMRLLDSAITFLNKIDCKKYIAVAKIGKAKVYYEKGNYLEAIETMKSIPDTLADPPILKFILLWELESKWAIAEGDREREMELYRRQDAILRDTINKNWLIYDSTLRAIVNTIRVSNSEAELVVNHYFYNKSKFTDKEIVLSEIDSMHNIVKGGDPFFEELRHFITEDPDYFFDPDFF